MCLTLNIGPGVPKKKKKSKLIILNKIIKIFSNFFQQKKNDILCGDCVPLVHLM